MVTVQTLKSYLRIEHDEEDAVLADLLKAAKTACWRFLNRPLIGDPDWAQGDSNDPQALVLTEAHWHAVRLLAGWWYRHREGDGLDNHGLIPIVHQLLSEDRLRRV